MIDFSTRGWNRTAKIICTISVIAMLFGAGFAIHRLSYLNNAVIANATISKVVKNESANGEFQYSTVYVFSDSKGAEVKVVSTEANRPPVGKVGDQIELLYLVNDPKIAIQDQFFSKWGLAVVTGGVGLAYYLIFAIVAHFTDKRLKRGSGTAAAEPAVA